MYQKVIHPFYTTAFVLVVLANTKPPEDTMNLSWEHDPYSKQVFAAAYFRAMRLRDPAPLALTASHSGVS